MANSGQSFAVTSVAGAGKTSTLEAIAKSLPEKKFLYLAFNRSVKDEAVLRFKTNSISNVHVETAHSLAYRATGASKYNIHHSGSPGLPEIIELLKIDVPGDTFIIARHVLNWATAYMNSSALTLSDCNYIDSLTCETRFFADENRDMLFELASKLLAKMADGSIPISHDFYLKEYQLSNPALDYDYILFDEGQDASPVMLDIFLKQSAQKIIVGDSHQQLYSWRYAVDSLKACGFPTMPLSQSFRFGQDIADIAMEALRLKHLLDKSIFVPAIIGSKPIAKVLKRDMTTGYIARSNLGLFDVALGAVTAGKLKNKNFAFEGGFERYTAMSDGSLYDALNLYNGLHKNIRSDLIASFGSIDDMTRYAVNSGDGEMLIATQIVKKHGNYLWDGIKFLKQSQSPRNSAKIIFSTAHRAKGMQYDNVILADDFINEMKIRARLNSTAGNDVQTALLNEEINILYVALTRTKHSIDIPFRITAPF